MHPSIRLRAVSAAAPLILLAGATGCSEAGAEEYRALPVPGAVYKVPQDVFDATLRGFPESREGRQELELGVTKTGDGRYVVLLTISGLLDDAVAAEQHRALLRPVEGGWRAEEVGERWRCYSGRGHGGWGTSPCR